MTTLTRGARRAHRLCRRLLRRARLADDKIVKIGVLNDMSSLYADIGGPNSVVAIKMAVEDSGLLAKGWKIDVLSGDHQNKPDVGVNIARQWIDNEKVDAIADTPNSGVALAVSNLVKEKNAVLLNSGAATADLTGKACTPNTVSYTYDTYMLANGTGKALTKAGGDSWFFLTADYAFGAALERDTTAVVTANGGKVLGGVKHPLNTSDFSSFLLQAQSSKAKVDRPRQCRRRHHQRDQAGVRIRHRRGRPEARRAAAVHQRRAFARPEDRAGPDLHRILLLGPERPDPRLVEAVRGNGQQARDAVDDPGRQLRHGAALSEGDGSARRQSA